MSARMDKVGMMLSKLEGCNIDQGPGDKARDVCMGNVQTVFVTQIESKHIYFYLLIQGVRSAEAGLTRTLHYHDYKY